MGVARKTESERISTTYARGPSAERSGINSFLCNVDSFSGTLEQRPEEPDVAHHFESQNCLNQPISHCQAENGRRQIAALADDLGPFHRVRGGAAHGLDALRKPGTITQDDIDDRLPL